MPESEVMSAELEKDYSDFLDRLDKMGISAPYNAHDMRAAYMQGLVKGMEIL